MPCGTLLIRYSINLILFERQIIIMTYCMEFGYLQISATICTMQQA